MVVNNFALLGRTCINMEICDLLSFDFGREDLSGNGSLFTMCEADADLRVFIRKMLIEKLIDRYFSGSVQDKSTKKKRTKTPE